MAKLCNREGQALALVVLFVAELLQTLAQVVGELPFVQLADDDLAEFREYLAYAVRQRVDVVEMAQRNALAFGAHLVDGVLQVSARTSPADHQ